LYAILIVQVRRKLTTNNEMLENEFIQNYLNNRGISDNVIEEAHLDYEDEWIIIPVILSDKTVPFCKKRRDPRNKNRPKYKYEKGASAKLYNAWMNWEEDEVVMVEGELDALTLQSHGIPAVSSTGGAKTFKDDWKAFFEDKKVYALYDYDEAGINGAIKFLEEVPHARLAWLPEENDPTDYLQEHDLSGLMEALADAKNYPINRDTEDDYKEAAELMLNEKKQLEEEALPAPARNKHAEIMRQYYLDKAEQLKNQRWREKKADNIPDSAGLDVERAKQVPITEFVDFNKSGFATSVWNPEEDTPSMKYYPEENRVHCFSAGKGGDVIDVVQQKFSLSFKEAVKMINSN